MSANAPEITDSISPRPASAAESALTRTEFAAIFSSPNAETCPLTTFDWLLKAKAAHPEPETAAANVGDGPADDPKATPAPTSTPNESRATPITAPDACTNPSSDISNLPGHRSG